MNSMQRLSFITAITGGLLSASGFAEELAVVKGNHVNARGQATFGSEVIVQLKKGETVKILDEVSVPDPKSGVATKWARIQIPANTPVWIHAGFVDPVTKAIVPKSLNVRSGPGEHFSILARLKKGEIVKELRTVGDWMEIEAPATAAVFVASNLLSKSPEESAPTPAPAPTVAVAPAAPSTPEPAVPPAGVFKPFVPTPAPETPPAVPKPTFSIQTVQITPLNVVTRPLTPPSTPVTPETTKVEAPASVAPVVVKVPEVKLPEEPVKPALPVAVIADPPAPPSVPLPKVEPPAPSAPAVPTAVVVKPGVPAPAVEAPPAVPKPSFSIQTVQIAPLNLVTRPVTPPPAPVAPEVPKGEVSAPVVAPPLPVVVQPTSEDPSLVPTKPVPAATPVVVETPRIKPPPVTPPPLVFAPPAPTPPPVPDLKPATLVPIPSPVKVEPPTAVAAVEPTPIPAPPKGESPATPFVLAKLPEPKLAEPKLAAAKLPEVKLPETKLPELAPRPLAVPPTIVPPTEAVLPQPIAVAELPLATPPPVNVEPPVIRPPVPAPVVVKLPEVKLPEVTPLATVPTPITVAPPAIPEPSPFPGIKPLSSIPTLRPSNAESPLVGAKLEERPMPIPPKINQPSLTTPQVIKAPQVKLPEFPPTSTAPPPAPQTEPLVVPPTIEPKAPPVVPPPTPPSLNPESITETVVLKPAPEIARAQPPTPPEPQRIGTSADPGAVRPASSPKAKEGIPAPLESSLLKLALAKTEEVKANPNRVPEPADVVPVPSAAVSPPKPAEELPADGMKPRAWYQRLFAKNSRATAQLPVGEDATATATPALKSDASPPGQSPRRVVTREGLVSSWVSGQAPSSFALEDPRTGKVIGYLASTNNSLAIKTLSGRRVIVTGEEATDSRWPTTPILTIETLKTID